MSKYKDEQVEEILDSFQEPERLTSHEIDKMRQRRMKKHHVSTILLHWFNAFIWVFMLLTGASLIVSSHYKFAPQIFIDVVHGLFNGKAQILESHIWLGIVWVFVFFVHGLFGFRRYVRNKELGEIKSFAKRWQTILHSTLCVLFGNDELCLDEDDFKWLKIRALGILGKTNEPLPPQGSFNAGQKLYGLLVGVMTPVIIITGLIMAFHLFSTTVVAWAVPVHFFAVGLVVSGLIIHVYMGAVFPEEKPAFFSMITGFVNEEFAYTHHFKWWKQMIRSEARWRKKRDGDVNLKDVLLDRFANAANKAKSEQKVEKLVREITTDIPQKVVGPPPGKIVDAPAKTKPYMQPYWAGIAIGLVLLATFFIMGRGFGASSAFARFDAYLLHLIAPQHAESSPVWGRYTAGGRSPFSNFLVFEVIGVLIGGFLSGYLAKRTRKAVDKGPGISNKKRYVFALLGGILMGIGARIARGCTSGLALTGGATLALGGWVFMLCVFAAGFVGAYFVRRLWL